MWNPIETAPKDGTSILLCRALDADGAPITGKSWGIFIQVAAWWESDDGRGGEWFVYCDRISETPLHFEPTHWMELPPNPLG